MSKQISTRAWIEYSASALINNLKRAKLNSDAKVMPVIKSDAYGHGVERVATVLAPYADAFAIATIEEGLALRRQLPDKPIVCLSGFFDQNQINVFQENNITPVIFNHEQIDWLETHGEFALTAWLKIDTGMGRLGFADHEVDQAYQRLKLIGCDVKIMSHFASADTPKAAQNENQSNQFRALTSQYKADKSFCNSAALLTRPQDHYDLLRPGIMLYGSSPFGHLSADELGLNAVSRLFARLISVKTIKAGETVGYSGVWRAQEPCTIGFVSIGYGDGYPRVVSEHAQVFIDGGRYSIIGRVSMDTLAIKLNSKSLSVGSKVELWGENISVDEVAIWAGTIAYELLCKITARVTKVYQ